MNIHYYSTYNQIRSYAIAPPTASRVERIDAKRLVDDHTHNAEHGRTAVLALDVQLERTYDLVAAPKSCNHFLLSHLHPATLCNVPLAVPDRS